MKNAQSEVIKVRATKMGYYDHARRREGDVFTLKPIEGAVKDSDGRNVKKKFFTAREQFSPNWMEEVKMSTPEKITTAPEALRAQQKILKEEKAGTQPIDDTVEEI